MISQIAFASLSDSKKQSHGKEGINQEWERMAFQTEGRPCMETEVAGCLRVQKDLEEFTLSGENERGASGENKNK